MLTTSHHSRGVLDEATDERITLAIPGTDYRLHLAVHQRPGTPVGKRIVGTIHAKATRVDVVGAGGRFIEPVIGRPRRIQGEVTATDNGENTITIDAGAVFVCTLTDQRQRADQFRIGDLVACDLLPGAEFTPAKP